MAYQPLPHDSVAPPPSGILPNTFPDSIAVWTIEVDAGSGQSHGVAVMQPSGAAPDPPDPGPDPEPERDPITVTTGASWADLNDYEVGSEVFANVAAYSGGNPDTTTYRYRWQTKPTADDAWTNGKWTNYSDHAMEVSITLTDGGQIRFQCQARDTSVDPVEQVNSFTPVKTVPWPELDVVHKPDFLDGTQEENGKLATYPPCYAGQELPFLTGEWSGGVPPVVYEFRHKEQMADGSWIADDAFQAQTNEVKQRTVQINAKGECGVQMHIESRATDAEGNREWNNGPLRDIVVPSLGEPSAFIDDVPYNPGSDTPTVEEGQAVALYVDLPDNDGGRPTWTWEVRSGAARLTPNGPYCVAFNETPGGNPFSVQVNFVDNNCEPTGDSVRFSMWTGASLKDQAPPAAPTWEALCEPLGDTLELAVGERHVIEQEYDSNYQVSYRWSVHDPYGVNTLPNERDIQITLENMQRLYPEMEWVEAQAAGPQLILHCKNPPEGDVPNRIHISFTAEVKHPMLQEPPHQYSYTKFIFE